MKTLIIVIFLFSLPSFSKTAVKNKRGLKRDFNFSDMSLVGNYKKSFGSNVIVEDEKSLDDLLGVRKNFKDRVRIEAKRKSLW